MKQILKASLQLLGKYHEVLPEVGSDTVRLDLANFRIPLPHYTDGNYTYQVCLLTVGFYAARAAQASETERREVYGDLDLELGNIGVIRFITYKADS